MSNQENAKIWLSPPDMRGEERKYVEKAFDTNWIAPLGPNVDEFEESLSKYCGVSSAAALSSGTAAIHLALKLVDVQPGDYVICQSFTFIGTINPVLYEGAIPVLIDSEKDSWNMDPELLEEAIIDLRKKNRRIAAIIPVHLYGMPAKMDLITAIGRKYEIPIIEDAAEALGSSFQGRRCGSLAKLSVLSFNGNKIISTSGGGALLSDNDEYIDRCRYLSTQARQPAVHYEHTEVGFNYRLSNVLAGIGIGQMKVLDDLVAKRRDNYERYMHFFVEELKNDLSVEFQPEMKGAYSNRWLTCMTLKPEGKRAHSRSEVIQVLQEANIESRPLWKPMHLQPVFKDVPNYTSGVSERLFEQGVCLPSGSSLTDDDFNRIFSAINSLVNT